MIKSSSIQSDYLGAAASTLCVIHCLATPFLFVIQSCSVQSCCDGGPLWWSAIDYIFIGITFFAVYHSSRTTSKPFMKYALYSTWLILSILVLNEKMGLLALSSVWKYMAAFSMVSVHLYNLRFCQCKEEACCTRSKLKSLGSGA